MPRKLEERLCPGCGKVKLMRSDCKTCGCKGVKTVQGASEPTASEEDNVEKNKRTIRIGQTRIHTVEQLIEKFEIDTNVWQVRHFTARKWEMGYIADTLKTQYPKQTPAVTPTGERSEERGQPSGERADAEGPQVTTVHNTAGYEELFAVSATFVRVLSEVENDGFAKENVLLLKENKRLKFQVLREKKYRDRIIETNASVDEMMSQIREIAQRLGEGFKLPISKVLPQQPAFKAAVSGSHSEDAVLLISDTHFGDVIRPGDTSGFPEFDLPIAGNRFGYTMEKARQILAIQRSAYPIKKLHVWFGGDMGNGDLHDAPLSNSLFIGPQVDFTFKMLKMGIEELASLTIPDPETGVRVVEQIELLFTCGNHMRESTAKFMPLKYQAQRTFDWLIYQLLIEWFKDTPHVSITQEMSPYIFKNIRGHRYGFAHGMQVGYRNSPDAQCKSMDAFLKTIRSLFDSPEFRRKNGLDGATFSRMCIGDIHVPVCFPRLISNGSLNGQNELGVNWGLEPIPCVQQLFGVTGRHLQTFHYEINSTHVQRAASDFNSYGYFAAEYEREFGRK